MVEMALNVEGGEIAVKISRWPMERLVCFIGFTTACMAVAAAIYKAPSGIFDGHRLAYYVSIVSAGVVGFGEVCVAAFWMSGSGGHHHPNAFARRRFVLCASILPLAFIAGLGGIRIFLE